MKRSAPGWLKFAGKCITVGIVVETAFVANYRCIQDYPGIKHSVLINVRTLNLPHLDTLVVAELTFRNTGNQEERITRTCLLLPNNWPDPPDLRTYPEEEFWGFGWPSTERRVLTPIQLARGQTDMRVLRQPLRTEEVVGMIDRESMIDPGDGSEVGQKLVIEFQYQDPDGRISSRKVTIAEVGLSKRWKIVPEQTINLFDRPEHPADMKFIHERLETGSVDGR